MSSIVSEDDTVATHLFTHLSKLLCILATSIPGHRDLDLAHNVPRKSVAVVFTNPSAAMHSFALRKGVLEPS